MLDVTNGIGCASVVNKVCNASRTGFSSNIHQIVKYIDKSVSLENRPLGKVHTKLLWDLKGVFP